MTKRIFKTAFLRGVLWGEEEGAEIVRDYIIDQGRWSIYHGLIFRYEGRLYRTSYSVGATESQDESPWEYSGEEEEVTEVEAYEKVVIDYRPVEG